MKLLAARGDAESAKIGPRRIAFCRIAVDRNCRVATTQAYSGGGKDYFQHDSENLAGMRKRASCALLAIGRRLYGGRHSARICAHGARKQRQYRSRAMLDPNAVY